MVNATESSQVAQLGTNACVASHLPIAVSCWQSLRENGLMARSSIQYHVAQILLHRPFISRAKVKAKGAQPILDKDSFHLKLCRESASEIVKLLRIYKHHYSLVRQNLS